MAAVETWTKQYLRVGEPSRIWVQVMPDAMDGSRKCDSSDDKHQ